MFYGQKTSQFRFYFCSSIEFKLIWTEDQKKLKIILEAKSSSSGGKFLSNDEGRVIDPRLFKSWIALEPREIWKINARIMPHFCH